MLDIEIETAPTQTALDIVSLNDFGTHLRLSPRLRANAEVQARMQAALEEAVSSLHLFRGRLNRSVLPCRLKRYLTNFPAAGVPIQLPYPDLIGDVVITIEDGSSPANVVSSSSYVVKNTIVPEILAKGSWPVISSAPRAVSVSYMAGFSTFPHDLKRLVKILAAHNMENVEATILEPRQMAINRKVEYGADYLIGLLKIPVSYDDWLE